MSDALKFLRHWRQLPQEPVYLRRELGNACGWLFGTRNPIALLSTRAGIRAQRADPQAGYNLSRVNPLGRAYQGNSSSNSAAFSVSVSDFDSAFFQDAFSSKTFLVAGHMDASSGNVQNIVSLGATTYGAGIIYRISPKKFSLYCKNASTTYELAQSTAVENADFCLAGRFDNGAGTIWLNGMPDGSSTASYSSIGANAATPTICGGNGVAGSGQRQPSGSINYIIIANEALPNWLLREITADPMRAFEPRSLRIWVPVGVSTPPSSAAGNVGTNASGTASKNAVEGASGLLGPNGELLAARHAASMAAGTLGARGSVTHSVAVAGATSASGKAGLVGACTAAKSAVVAAGATTGAAGAADGLKAAQSDTAGVSGASGSVTAVAGIPGATSAHGKAGASGSCAGQRAASQVCAGITGAAGAGTAAKQGQAAAGSTAGVAAATVTAKTASATSAGAVGTAGAVSTQASTVVATSAGGNAGAAAICSAQAHHQAAAAGVAGLLAQAEAAKRAVASLLGNLGVAGSQVDEYQLTIADASHWYEMPAIEREHVYEGLKS